MQKKLKLYLDDERIPLEDDWILVRDYYEFVEKINTIGLENFEIISLDHDLGANAIGEYHNNVRTNGRLNYSNLKDEKTGYDCAKYLVDYAMNHKVDLPEIQVHSANPVGAVNIITFIRNFLKFSGKPENCSRGYVPHKIRGY